MKKTKNGRKIKLFVIVFFIFFITLFYYFKIISPIIKTYSSQEVKSITERAVNIAVNNVINRTLSYDSLIDINYAPNGEIVSLSANQYEINSITREIVKETQYLMKNIGQDGLSIKIGTFSGIPFLIDKGPIIHLNLVPIGVVSGQLNSEFSSVGINMTKHTLLLNINTHVSIVLPIKSYDVHSSNQVLLSESIILGNANLHFAYCFLSD